MHGIVGSTVSTGAGAGQEIDRGVSRRSVLRTGALVSAWSVPLVQVVAAAPAVAASGGLPAALAITSAEGIWGKGQSRQLDITTDIQNTGSGATVSLQVTFTFPAGWSGTVPTAPTGWSTSSTSSPYVFTPATQLEAGQTLTLAPAFQSSTVEKGQALSIDVSVTAAGVPSAGTQIAVAARP